MSENPLLSPEFEIPFDKIRPEHVAPAIREALAEAQKRLPELKARCAGEPLTYEITLQALDDLVEGVVHPYRLARHLLGVMNGPELRQAFNEVLPEVTAFLARLATDHDLWQIVARYAETPEGAALEGVRQRHLRKTEQAFRRAGASLPEAERKRVEALNVELAQLSTKFSENVLDATNDYELVITSEEALAGLPESALRRARASAASRGLEGYRFTLQAPSYLPFVKYVEDRELRRELHEAFLGVGAAEPYDNRGIMREILARRRELAQLLGYADFADLQADDRMIGTGAHAAAFEQDLEARTRPYFDAEVAELERHARTELNLERLEAWDVPFVSEKLRKERFSLDEEELRPYFPLPQVLSGLFDLTERLFGVKVTPADGVPTWHHDVDVYHFRHEDGTFLGALYADWFPRESKRNGAWMNGLRTGGPGPAGFEPHVGIIACNFTPPEDGRPALLTHSEVETVFHEFGHLLHHVMCRVEVRARSSMNVAWDFVELPSQIMENWTWETSSPSTSRRAKPCRPNSSRHWQAAATSSRPPPRCASSCWARSTWPSTATSTRKEATTCWSSAAAQWRAWKCGRTSRKASASRASRTSSRAVTRPVTTPTSGARYSTPTPSAASPRRASSTPRLGARSPQPCSRGAMPTTRRNCSATSWAANRTWTPSSGAAWVTPP